MGKLDRILVSPSQEDLFPLVDVVKLARELSDQNPLALKCGVVQHEDKKPRGFMFDVAWLKHDDFLPLVKYI